MRSTGSVAVSDPPGARNHGPVADPGERDQADSTVSPAPVAPDRVIQELERSAQWLLDRIPTEHVSQAQIYPIGGCSLYLQWIVGNRILVLDFQSPHDVAYLRWDAVAASVKRGNLKLT